VSADRPTFGFELTEIASRMGRLERRFRFGAAGSRAAAIDFLLGINARLLRSNEAGTLLLNGPKQRQRRERRFQRASAVSSAVSGGSFDQ
jgi:hypothetical protein